MTDPPPSHLHGSNLVIEETLSLELGWDFGNLDGQPFIAEDLVLGLTAYMKYGKDVFGWHGAELLEQPPLTLGDSIRQRIRWVTGVWQALEMLKRSKGFKKLDWKERFQLRASISYRATLYSMSFFTALFFYFFIAVWFSSEVLHLEVFKVEIDFLRYWAIILLPGLVLWLAGNQIGLKRILERKKVSRGDKAIEHFKILLISPVGAPVETISALYATLKWFLGDRKVTWIPTKK
jgi:cellulose synthase/poly-beta-1,6-N-acetylglucosamine synthase-like glycosyltransferase